MHTDYKALKFLSACADDSFRIARWTAFLGEFDLEVCHIPGKENDVADTLSRRNVNNGYAKKERDQKDCGDPQAKRRRGYSRLVQID